jgi:serine protease AprX
MLTLAAVLLAANAATAPIDAEVLAQLGPKQSAPATFLVVLKNATDANAVRAGLVGEARLNRVFDALYAQDQDLRRFASAHGIESAERFWLVNTLLVTGGSELLQKIASDPQVSAIKANTLLHFKPPIIEFGAEQAAPKAIRAATPGQVLIGATQLWALGIKGAGVVIAGEDTGYAWQHPALITSYRGWNGSVANHNYNWFDGIADNSLGTGGSCGINSVQPCDDGSHGTHTMGTMVGDDAAAEQVGAAPEARWIGCRNMNQGDGRPATYLRCMQWMLAPTDLAGANPDTSKTPHVINNSWGCPPSETCTVPDVLQAGVANLRAAGILFVAAAGNSGSGGCGTVSDPPAIYPETFTVGNIRLDSTMNTGSSRGPVTVDGSNRRKPDVSGPGTSIRSSIPPASYASFSGTSMAAPHVAGAAALLMSAFPNLKRNPDAVEDLLERTAVPITLTLTCGGIGTTTWPNNIAGFGRIDVHAAYQAQLAALEGFQNGFE